MKVTPKTTNGEELRVALPAHQHRRPGRHEIAQVYVTLPMRAGEPFQRLVGWDQVTLAPGEFRNVEITLGPADLAELHLLQVWNSASDTLDDAEGHVPALRRRVVGQHDRDDVPRPLIRTK